MKIVCTVLKKILYLQKLLKESRAGEVYVVECEATNANIPYADNFSILTHTCITRQSEAGDTSRYFASAKINYKKSTWGLIKSLYSFQSWKIIKFYLHV